MIDFDDIDGWEPELAAVLSPHLPSDIGPKLAKASPKYIEDARDLLLDLSDRNAVREAMLGWIRSETIAGYHGSRLNDAEVASVQAVGLIPLEAEARRHRLERALSPHRNWEAVRGQLGALLQANGPGKAVGRREGQVHLTLSRSGLTKSFNHYLLYGSEFDQHIAHALLGKEGLELLARDGEPVVVQVAVPGPQALEAAHPFGGIEIMIGRDKMPNIIDEMLEAHSFRLAHPGFQARTLKADCGMIFRTRLPAAWISSINPWVTHE